MAVTKHIVGRPGDEKCRHNWVLRGKLRETHNLNFCTVCGREEIVTDSDESADGLKSKFREKHMVVD